MSSSGITPINSGPLNIRTYLDSSVNNTYILGNYDYPAPSGSILNISTGGLLVPTNSITISSLTVSSIYADNAILSTSYLSTVFAINSTINFRNRVNIDSTSNGEISFLVNGSTVFTEPGAQSTSQNATVTIWGLPSAAPINQQYTTTTTYTITSSISSINFQLVGAGGNSTFSNPLISQIDLPGYGAYISGRLLVKQNDRLQFVIGQQGTGSGGSGGTSLVYFSSIGGSNFVSSLVCVAGAGGGNGYVPSLISSSSGGGHGGGANGSISVSNVDFIANGTQGYDGLSTINGILVSDTDGGQGGQTTGGGAGGPGNPPGAPNNGAAGSGPNITNLIVTGGLGQGGVGGIFSVGRQGGWGGGGYTGGGGGGAGATTTAGGGGGSTYIAISTLSSILSNVVCLGGQFFADNNSGSAFGGGYGSPNRSGFAEFDGYAPNMTLYTNGDIECRVLKYTVLDPPIDAIGGSSALWSKYPAVQTVHLNDNRLVECGGIEVDSGGVLVDAGGIDVTGNSVFRNNLNINGNTSTLGNVELFGSTFHFTPQDPSYFNAFKIEMNGSNYLTYKSTVNGQNATLIQNSGGGPLVLGTNIPVITINGTGSGNNNVGIGILAPATSLVVKNPSSTLTGLAVNSSDVNTIIGNVATSNYGSIQVTSGGSASNISATPYNLSLQPLGGEVITGSNLTVGGNLTVNGNFIHPDVPPVGAINMYAGSTDPTGWFICNGRSLDTTTYSALHSVINYTFGGSGLTFNIPDMRDRFPVGVGAYAMNQKGGVSSITLTTNELPVHSHPITDVQHSHTTSQNLRSNDTTTNNDDNVFEKDTNSGSVNANFTVTVNPAFTGITGTNNAGNGQPFDNRPPYIGINYIIKW